MGHGGGVGVCVAFYLQCDQHAAFRGEYRVRTVCGTRLPNMASSASNAIQPAAPKRTAPAALHATLAATAAVRAPLAAATR